MSAIGGFYNFDGAPADIDQLIRLGRGLAVRGLDGGSHFKSNSLAMIYRAFNTNKESRREIQPLVSNLGHVLCWDGRLDNRDDLIAILLTDRHEDHTDPAIIMAAYLKWGIDFLPRIIGDFALSLWDPLSRLIILARDVIGSRDLYYKIDQNHIVWSSELTILLDLSADHLEVNDEYIAGYLTRLPEPDQSPFKGINAVPPAHAVIIKNGQIKISRFWGLDPNIQIRYRNDAEYEEHFRHLFQKAVKCCLRTDAPVWADLSGGLDSSSIACMADQLIRSGEAEAPHLETVSCIRDESPSSNEARFIRYAEERIGKVGHHLPESKFPILSPDFSEPSVIPNPLDVYASYHKRVNAMMTEASARVRLCGNGGDQIFNSVPDPSPELTDLLVQGHLLRLNRSLSTWAHDQKKPYVHLLWKDTVLPILPRKMQVALKQELVAQLPDWFNPQFVKDTNLLDRMLGPRDPFGFRSPSSRQQCIGFLGAVREVAAGYVRSLQNVDLRMPLLHRPLVEFMQAIPQEQRVRPSEGRSLQRRALKDVLPREILTRKGKGNPSEALLRAACREHARLRSHLSDSYVARCGYVIQQGLSAAFERMRYGDQRSGWVMLIIPLEFWLRSLERRGSQTKMNAAFIAEPEIRAVAAG